jgi:hypothetical protein
MIASGVFTQYEEKLKMKNLEQKIVEDFPATHLKAN